MILNLIQFSFLKYKTKITGFIRKFYIYYIQVHEATVLFKLAHSYTELFYESLTVAALCASADQISPLFALFICLAMSTLSHPLPTYNRQANITRI